MKKPLTLLVYLILCHTLVSQNGMYIEFKISSSRGNAGSVKVNYSEMGSVSEFSMSVPQIPGGGFVMKTLNKKNNPGTVYFINDNNKTYSESSPTDPANQDTKTYKVKKLGEETVSGYKCVHALVTEGSETHEVWNTKDIAGFDKYNDAFKSNKKVGSQKRDQALKDAGCEGFPVKAIHVNKSNPREGDVTMELVKIEKKSFNDSDFEIPKTYSKTAPGTVVNPDMKSQQDIMKMTPEERAKYAEEMKKKYGGK